MPSVPPQTTGAPGTWALVRPLRPSAGYPPGTYGVGALGRAEQLWTFALGDLRLMGGTFKVLEAAPNGLYLGRIMTQAEYDAL